MAKEEGGGKKDIFLAEQKIAADVLAIHSLRERTKKDQLLAQKKVEELTKIEKGQKTSYKQVQAIYKEVKSAADKLKAAKAPWVLTQ